jgi:hypothetical protein
VDDEGPINDGNWGLVAVIRDVVGCVVAATCWLLLVLPQSDVAEGQALLKGITFANDLLFCMLIVELDDSNVITAINEFQPQQSYLGAIVEDRGSFFSQISII